METATMFHPSVEVELTHQRQQSQDSGAFIDWNSEDSGSPTGLTDEFVTVVSVESKEIPSPFVTVLEIGDDAARTRANGECTEEVLVYRLPGERLGFGLKFEGGQNTAEKVRRLFIQSSAADSPASRAKCSWGSLVEGDEILHIDGHAVNGMTRLDCVRCLKESNVVIKLVVRHPADDIIIKTDTISISTPTVISAEMKKRSPPPPPIPPRKVPRKSPAVPPRDDVPQQVFTNENVDDENRQQEPLYSPVPKARSVQSEHKTLTRVPSNPKHSPDAMKGVVRRNSLRTVPPEAEVYLDLISQEDDIRSNWGSESDDTASTISTIVGMPTNNNSLSDLPFDSVHSDFLFSKLNGDKEPDSVSCDDRSYGQSGDDSMTLQPPLSFQDAPLSYGNEEVRPSLELQEADEELFMSSLKNYPEESLDEVDLSLDGSTVEKSTSSPHKKTSLIPRLAKSLGLLSPPKPSPRKEIPEPVKPRSNKKRPPPPPPPVNNEQTQPADAQTKSLKSSIPYLKKKKSKDDDRKAIKLEKKSKKEKFMEKEEAIVPYLEQPSSPEEEDESVKLCWPVPELPREDSADVFPPEQDMEFGVEAVTSSMFSWGSSKQLETIGEDEEEMGDEEHAETRTNDDMSRRASLPWNSQSEDRMMELDTPSCERYSTQSGTDAKENAKPTEPFDTDNKSIRIDEPTVSEIADDPDDELSTADNAHVLNTEKSVHNESVETSCVASSVCNEKPAADTFSNATTLDFLNEERLLSSLLLIDSVNRLDKARDCDIGNCGQESVASGLNEVRVDAELNPEEGTKEDVCSSAIEDSSGNVELNEELSDYTGGGNSESTSSVVPATRPLSDGDLKEDMDAVAAPSLGPSFPAPPFSRMPPDGHEFPQKYREEMPGKTIASDGLKSVPPLPSTEPPRKINFQMGRGKTVAGWQQDERSKKSVRDKIAMFQSVPDAPVSPSGYSKLCKFKSSEDVLCDEDERSLPQTKVFSRSVLSMDKIGGGYSKNSFSSGGDSGGEFGGRTQSTLDLTSSSSSAYSSSCSPDSSLSSTTSSYLGYSSTLPRKMSSHTSYEGKAAGKANGVTRTSSFNIHSRSQSMLDINPVPYGRAPREDENKQASLNTLVEQRRRNMSKLRGLVIPEKSTETCVMKQSILDLPEIKSKDLILPSKHSLNEKERRTSVGCYPASTVAPSTNLLSPPWKMPSQSPAIPKYSPAFKRKNISVYGSTKSDYLERYKSPTLAAPSKPPRFNGVSPRYSFDSSRPLLPDSTSDYEKISRHSLIRPTDFPKSIDYFGKHRSRCEEDSDNDSAVSSSRSSISPPASPLLGGHQALSPSEIEKIPLARTLSSETTASGASTTSTLTSGSHASCSSDSESHGKRILKPQSVEAINRKNVLTSAKYSRGFDIKNGSPRIQRKILEDMLANKSADQVDYTEMYLKKHSQENNNNNKDIVCYTLAENYKSLNRVPEVKIAFLNHVECPDESLALQSKIEDADNPYCNYTKNVPLPVPRRVSVPTYFDPAWGNDSALIKTDSNGHIPLTPTMSSESIRSRASSADTIVERPVIMEAEIVPSRLRTLQSETVSESECSLIDDTAESGPEDNSSSRFSTACSSTGSDSVSSGWSYRASDAVDSSGEFTVPLPRSSRPSIDNESGLRKRGSSGSLLDGYDDGVEQQKPNGRVSSERINSRNRRSVSVNDIRKAFEKAEATKAATEKVNGSSHARVSSLDSTTSDDSGSNLHREQFGSITSLASSTSLISPQELQSLIDEANLTLEEATGGAGAMAAGSHDVLVVILHRDSVGGSVGITLAGGADYESKEITVHKVLAGSPADRDGRIQKGDRVLSINGRSMKGCTHRESLAILKAPRPEVVLVVSRLKSDCGETSLNIDDALTSGLRSSLSGGTSRPPRILEGSLLTESETTNDDGVARGPPTSLQLVKDGAGLGFSLEGGKDSPMGDKPLVVKKIFTGGAAEKSGLLKAGDEILNVNGVDVSQMSRIEAWKLMKRLQDGNVAIIIRRMVENSGQ